MQTLRTLSAAMKEDLLRVDKEAYKHGTFGGRLQPNVEISRDVLMVLEVPLKLGGNSVERAE